MDPTKLQPGLFDRRGAPGGPACRVEYSQVRQRHPDGALTSAVMLTALDDGGEVELLRATAEKMGIQWGRDDGGWWALMPAADGRGPAMVWPTVEIDGDKGWAVWRQDDNGNRFLVRDALSKDDAHQTALRFEARGHKQTYWIEPM